MLLFGIVVLEKILADDLGRNIGSAFQKDYLKISEATRISIFNNHEVSLPSKTSFLVAFKRDVEHAFSQIITKNATKYDRI